MIITQAMLREYHALDCHRLALSREAREIDKKLADMIRPTEEWYGAHGALPEVEPGTLSLDLRPGRANVPWKTLFIAIAGEAEAEAHQRDAKRDATPSIVVVDSVAEKRDAYWEEKGRETA